MKKRLRISFVINILLMAVLITVIVQTNSLAVMKTKMDKKSINEESVVLRQAHYDQRQTLFERLSVTRESTVMLGDSMILYNEWAEEFPIAPILNRGIGGDTTFGLLKRLDTITSGKPKRIVLMIGVNDISKGFTEEQTLKNYDKILSTIEEKSPSTKIIMTSVLPVNNELYGYRVHNSQVVSLNTGLKKLASKHKILMIDIHDKFLKDDHMDSQYTSDGLHLNGKGYAIWINALRPYMDN
ncbi:lipase [Rummeliibacillus sp. TYF005]|uniref:GDSL-type esterase/lipase family protein n=1 Tax=Rummeliibacillus sp. TYF005 TaxID=2058214 RepID=UPI000F522093|nr:GDSL-type esterase/lipase family protein [Rummeliibacillus sp. TYF005]RPJ94454.1 lipase [Rummeliibacillus sp. TYF005]